MSSYLVSAILGGAAVLAFMGHLALAIALLAIALAIDSWRRA